MIDFKVLWRTQFSITCLILCVMACSLLTISSHSLDPLQYGAEEAPFFTSQTMAQFKWFALGLVVYFLSASFDYHRLREWAWLFYLVSIAMLIGVFFTAPIANVHRWYRVPGLGMSIQPSELAKITCVMAMAWYLERKNRGLEALFFCGLIAAIPFALILKQPDLGAALVIYPITLGMLYFADVHPRVIRLMGWTGLLALFFIMAIFLGFLSHEELRPWATQVFREYQYERLNPGGYHNVAGQIAVSLGSFWGQGWRQGVYSNQGWLPEPYTDSIFASFSEEFGLVGSLFLLGLYGAICWQTFEIAARTKDRFGQLLVAGLGLYLGIHVLVNISMMIGLFPITGVALPLMSYGGSASLFAFMALGIIQSVWARRFMF